jgi:putative flippase GtrA
MKRRVPSVPLRFVVVGLANTIIGLAIVYFLKWSGEVGDTAANVGGYSLGLATSFVLNRNWTFGHSGAWLPAFARFFTVFAIAYAANLGTVLVLIDQFGINGYAAQAFGVPPYTALFYIGSRYVAFPDGELVRLRPDFGWFHRATRPQFPNISRRILPMRHN